MSIERRKHVRANLAVEVNIASGSNFYAGRTRDISLGGLFIETDLPFPIGTVLSVDLYLVGRKHSALAEVMWALDRPDGSIEGIGVRFWVLPSRTRAAILDFMRRRAPLDFEMEPVEIGPPPLPAQAPPR